jgi:hypothetical protein
VKIKITEYFPMAMLQPGFMPDNLQNTEQSQTNGTNLFSPEHPGSSFGVGILSHPNGIPENHPGASGARYYTIQRVNGNGGNGKGDGVAGPHKHTLEESDAIKKSSVERHKMKEAKEKKKTEVCIWSCLSLRVCNSLYFIHFPIAPKNPCRKIPTRASAFWGIEIADQGPQCCFENVFEPVIWLSFTSSPPIQRNTIKYSTMHSPLIFRPYFSLFLAPLLPKGPQCSILSSKATIPSVTRQFSTANMSDKANQKTYHKKATGAALVTVKKHVKENELKLYGSCFW